MSYSINGTSYWNFHFEERTKAGGKIYAWTTIQWVSRPITTTHALLEEMSKNTEHKLTLHMWSGASTLIKLVAECIWQWACIGVNYNVRSRYKTLNIAWLYKDKIMVKSGHGLLWSTNSYMWKWPWSLTEYELKCQSGHGLLQSRNSECSYCKWKPKRNQVMCLQTAIWFRNQWKMQQDIHI
jgi:hypothetical protein